MLLFELGIVSSMLAFPFIIPFISLVQDFLISELKVNNNIFLVGAVVFFGQTFSLILYYISMELQKKNKVIKKVEDIILVNTFEIDSSTNQQLIKNSTKYANLYIILTCVLEFFLYVLMVIFLSNVELELIYCEVFICNFCGLEVNTKKMIEARYTVEGEIEKKALQDLEQKTNLEKKNSINDDDKIY